MLTQEIRTLITELFAIERSKFTETLQTFEARLFSHTTSKTIEETFQGVWERQEYFEKRILKIITEAFK